MPTSHPDAQAVTLRRGEWTLIDGTLDNEISLRIEEYVPDDANDEGTDPIVSKLEEIRQAGWDQIEDYETLPAAAEVTVVLPADQWRLAMRVLRESYTETKSERRQNAAIEAAVNRQFNG